MKSYFVTSSGTDVGKTFVTAILARQLRKQSFRVELLKPVITGFSVGDRNCDSAILLESLDQNAEADHIVAISPWRYNEPISPDMAAQREGRPIDFDELVRFSKTNPLSGDTSPDFHFVEGIGGVMVPLTEKKTVLDWIHELGYPAILVVGSYLGSLNHTLISAMALERRGVEIAAVIVSESTLQPVPLADTVGTLKRFLPASHVLPLPRLTGGLDAWQEAPDLVTPLFLEAPEAAAAGAS
ncbi:MAG: dethiobiotin synthase [Alphaproteobacteria bacterium]|nr:dethiobiotin synthase [Alphaproteobacteria bacterium]